MPNLIAFRPIRGREEGEKNNGYEEKIELLAFEEGGGEAVRSCLEEEI